MANYYVSLAPIVSRDGGSIIAGQSVARQYSTRREAYEALTGIISHAESIGCRVTPVKSFAGSDVYEIHYGAGLQGDIVALEPEMARA